MRLLGHQGDLAIFKLPTIPVGADEIVRSGILVAGTGSGHAHQIEDLAAATVRRAAGDDLLYLDVTSPTRIVHGRARDFAGKEADNDYHNPIHLEPGCYAVGVVHETDWLTKTIRKVVD